jgi:hypothetical protein
VEVKQIEKNGSYAVYCGITKRSLIGGLNGQAASVVRSIILNDGFYCVINKRNGYMIERLMPSKDEAKAYADGYGGCIVSKENVYLGESAKHIQVASKLNGDIVEIIDGRINKDLKEKYRLHNAIGNEHNKRALGSYTDSQDERNYVKAILYNSVKSSIINKPISRVYHKASDINSDELIEMVIPMIRKLEYPSIKLIIKGMRRAKLVNSYSKSDVKALAIVCKEAARKRGIIK